MFFSTLTIIFSIETPNMYLIDATQNDDTLDNIKTSGFWDPTHIHIDNNWSDTADAYDWCYKENGFYIIENVTIPFEKLIDFNMVVNSNKTVESLRPISYEEKAFMKKALEESKEYPLSYKYSLEQ